MNYDFLLRTHRRTGYPGALRMLKHTLAEMARGGIYDQIGGGFHRYAVDAQWLVPHFEKMLYDNALLARLYLHAFQATGDLLFRRICCETLDYVLREMTDPAGGFYASQDADSEGVEGKFYVWTPGETAALLGADDARLLNAYYDITAEGNFEGHSIAHVPRDEEAVAREAGVPVERLREAVARGRARLYEARALRTPPGKDTKVLSAWNGMMLAAFAEAAAALDRDDYRRAAQRNAEFLLGSLAVRDRGELRLLRTWKDGQAKLNAYLEDYAALADGLIALYEATFEPRWLVEVRALADGMIAHFWSDAAGGFYDTSDDHEALIARPRDVFDNATPSGGGLAAAVLLKLGALFGDEDYARRAVESLKGVSALMRRYPSGFGQWLGALDFYLAHPKEIALVGKPEMDTMRRLTAAVFAPYLPNRIVLHSTDGANPLHSPLLEDKRAQDGHATAYVCQNYTCLAPTTDPAELESQLRE
jgi:uncharacterized protein YyaL (SSP411 family)